MGTIRGGERDPADNAGAQQRFALVARQLDEFHGSIVGR